MSGHTPGPWSACKADRGGCQCGHVWDLTGNILVATATFIGMVDPEDLESQEVAVHSLDEAKANARLVAAAPAMLTALQATERQAFCDCDVGAAERPHEPGCFVPLIRAAIKSATGATQ